MRFDVQLLFLAVFASFVVSWPSDGKDGDSVGCPYMQRKYNDESGSAACPLKDKCPLYAAVVQGEGDVSLDSLKAADGHWSLAAQSKSIFENVDVRMSPRTCLSVFTHD